MRFPKKGIATSFLVVVIVICSLISYKIVRWKAYVWLPDYIERLAGDGKRDGTNVTSGPTHVIFLFVDHFEPGKGEKGSERCKQWLERYTAIADRHSDSYGRKPQHTWFYAYEQRNTEVMEDLSSRSSRLR